MLSDYEQQLRDRFLSAPVIPAPDPWRPVCTRRPIGGLLGVGFGLDPVSGNELLMVVSSNGHGVLDTTTGRRLARDDDPDPEWSTPTGPDLSCPGLGPLAGTRIRIAGLYGGGLHTTTTTQDGWTIQVVSPDWPNHRVLLSAHGGLYRGAAGETWWHIFHSEGSELRTAGFSSSGRTLAVATSSDITLWTTTRTDRPA